MIHQVIAVTIYLLNNFLDDREGTEQLTIGLRNYHDRRKQKRE
jgi:hypothetical protein